MELEMELWVWLTRTRRAMLAAVVAASVVAAATIAGGATAAPPSTVLFTQTAPGIYMWTVPRGVRSVTFDVYGAAGGSSTRGFGGLGGQATATFAVHPGQVFQIVIGGRGGDGVFDGSPGGFGGFNGGGSTIVFDGGGGGASDIRSGPCAATLSCDLTARIVVAGGGGGVGDFTGGNVDGGSGGGLTGGDGASFGGRGGKQTEGGSILAAGECCAGSFGVGGDKVPSTDLGGGGGGGWFGGGAGPLGRGGGGGSGFIALHLSSFIDVSGTMEHGVQSGDGQVIITKA